MPTTAVFYVELFLSAKSLVDFNEFKVNKSLYNWKAQVDVLYNFFPA